MTSDAHVVNCCRPIYSGNEHTVVLSRAGEVFAAGYNDNGQCGQGAKQRVGVLTRIPLLVGKRAVQVTCRSHEPVLQAQAREVYRQRVTQTARSH